MSGPPYHLRINKAADRFALIEAIRRLPKLNGWLEEYTYYGLGGSYLEDMRILYEYCPELKLVSIEENKNVYQRQMFHKPCVTLDLTNINTSSFITDYDSNDDKSIFWLDYTKLEFNQFEEFKTILTKVADNSMVKITLRADPRDYRSNPATIEPEEIERFRTEFSSVIPSSLVIPPRKQSDFALLVQQMLRIASQQAFHLQASHNTFMPISSFYYSDGSWMYTLTGLVCSSDKQQYVINAYKDWEFANLNWGMPKLINIPDLSTKERLRLQELLPCKNNTGEVLRTHLGYLIDDDVKITEKSLEQYAAFHRYFPYFLRGVP
jgi:hypothetical protein